MPTIFHARMDLCHLRRAVPRHRRAARAVPDLRGRAPVRRLGRPALDDRRGPRRATTPPRSARRSPTCSGSASPRRSGSGSAPCSCARRTATCCGTRSRCSTTPRGTRSPRRAASTPICISHPHFYAAHVDIADAFDARVLLPRADEQWIQRRSRPARAVRRPRRRAARRDARPHRRPLRRRRGAALGGGLGGPGRAADRRHHHGGAGPRVGELHVELPEPHPARPRHHPHHRRAGRPVPVRPHLRRLVGQRGGHRRPRRGPPLGRALHRPRHRR